jgi:uncharacterized membrane protein
MMYVILLSLVIGVVAGLRALLAPAAVSVAAYLGLLHLQNTALAFMGGMVALPIFVIGAGVEFVTDQLPKTPSRKTPIQFGVRLVSAAFCGTAIGLANGAPIVGAVSCLVGAVLGTMAGAEGRAMLAGAFHRDLPAALIEDAVALGGAALAFGLIK